MALQQKTFTRGGYSKYSWSNGYVISLTLTEESISVENNTSMVSYLFTISNTENNRFVYNNCSWHIVIGGSSVEINNFSFDLSENYTTQIMASGRMAIAHNTNGTGSITYDVLIPDIKSSVSSGPPAMALSGTWALTTIQRVPPTISDISVTDGNGRTFALTNDRNIFVRDQSYGVITAKATAYDGAVIKKMEVVCDDGQKLSSDTGTLSGTLYNVGSGKFTFSATDNRGKTTVSSVQVPMVDYVKLTCNLGDNKPDGEGNMTVKVSGNYFAGNFGVASNALTVMFRYKQSGTDWVGTSAEWKHMQPVISGNKYTAQMEISGLDYQKTYIFQARAEDVLDFANTPEYKVKAMPVFDWGENDFCFHVPVSGISADMVGARYHSTSGSTLLKKAGAESGLLFVKDGGNLDNYYLGVFYGYQPNSKKASLYTLCANTLNVTTNTYGTVTVQNAEGDAAFAVIPFVQI